MRNAEARHARAQPRERPQARDLRHQPARWCHARRRRREARGSWEENLRLARWADRLGLDAIVPIARWRGYGGEANLGDRSFETFTWATGLLAATRRIQVFATMHVPLGHPLAVAKMGATADHISGGRFGLNIVAG
jgi:FMNH2-dependent dimethyl sulfone monooxygenase